MIVYVSLVAPSVVYRQFSQPDGSKKCLLENYYLFLVLSFYLQKSVGHCVPDVMGSTKSALRWKK